MRAPRFNPLIPILAALALSGHRDAAAGDYALVVGVRDYDQEKAPGFNDLPYTGKDALGVQRALERAGFKVVALTTELGKTNGDLAPNSVNIKRELDALKDKAQGTRSTLIVSLAGHGRTQKIEGSEKTAPFFFPADAEYDKNKKMTNLLDVEVDIVAKMMDSTAGRKYLFLECCRNTGGGIDMGETRKRPSVDNGVLERSKVNILYSCKETETSQQDDTIQQGIFSHFLILGLRGEAKKRPGAAGLSFNDLIQYLKNNVPDYAQEKLKHIQNPEAIPADPSRTEEIILKPPPVGFRELIVGSNPKSYLGFPEGRQRNYEREVKDREGALGSEVTDVTFTGKFLGGDFGGKTFRDCRFVDCTFRKVIFYEAKMINCVFKEVNFKGSNTSKVTFTGGQGYATCSWSEDSSERPRKLPAAGDDAP